MGQTIESKNKALALGADSACRAGAGPTGLGFSARSVAEAASG
jgi:hypothetical protein